MTLSSSLGGLISYAAGEAGAARFLEASRGLPVIIDSGAWSVFRGAAKVEPAVHAEAVLRLQAGHPEARFIGLDVIGDPEASFRNWTSQRESGAKVEPTIHLGVSVEDARRYFERMDPGEWVNLGGMAHLQRQSAMRSLAGWAATIMREAPHLRFHALGAVTPYLLDRLPFDSADSTYWKLPLVIGRRLSLFSVKGRSWVGVDCRRGSVSTYRSAGRHADVLRSYGVQLADWPDLSQDDDALLRLSVESHRRLVRYVEGRHRKPFTAYLAAISVSDLPLLQEET